MLALLVLAMVILMKTLEIVCRFLTNEENLLQNLKNEAIQTFSFAQNVKK